MEIDYLMVVSQCWMSRHVSCREAFITVFYSLICICRVLPILGCLLVMFLAWQVSINTLLWLALVVVVSSDVSSSVQSHLYRT